MWPHYQIGNNPESINANADINSPNQKDAPAAAETRIVFLHGIADSSSDVDEPEVENHEKRCDSLQILQRTG